MRPSLEKYFKENPVNLCAVYLPHFGVWALKTQGGRTVRYISHPADVDSLEESLKFTHTTITGWFQQLGGPGSELASCDPWTLRVKPVIRQVDYIFIDENDPERCQKDWIKSQPWLERNSEGELVETDSLV